MLLKRGDMKEIEYVELILLQARTLPPESADFALNRRFLCDRLRMCAGILSDLANDIEFNRDHFE